ncbi:MAG: MATE family efflux transporter [Zavarzinia sp.]|nr:MATE family efflux transporter [Zavarzinia sp.]
MALTRLALPIIMARIGLTLMLVADNMIVGHFGAGPLAAFALGLMLVQTGQMLGLGLLMGSAVEMAAAFGRDALDEVGRIWRRAIAYAVVIGLAGVALSHAAPAIFIALGQEPGLAASAGEIAALFGWSLPPVLIYIASIGLLEATGRPYVGVVLLLVANLVNLGLGLLLGQGGLGLPALGAFGVTMATLAARLLLAGGALAYILLLMPGRRSLGRPRWSDHRWADGRRQRRIGYAEGLSLGIESGAFAAMTLFAGWAGAVQLAAYTIAINLNMLMFMVAVGIGGAAAVQVSRARGRGDRAAMARSAATALLIYTGVMLLVGLAFVALPERFAGFYTGDAALLAVTIPVVAGIGFLSLIDGAQRVVANILRGYGDTWLPTASHLFAYVVVMVPAGHLLALRLGLGAGGLVLAIALASVVATGLLLARLARLKRRPR